MRTKSTIAMLAVMLLVAILVVGRAHADENSTSNHTQNETGDNHEDINDDDREEIKIMCAPFGAQVRMLELEKSVQKNILKGQKVVDMINSGNISANATNLTQKVDTLNGILDQMQALVDQIHNTNFENTTHEDLAQQFVDLKHQATNLTAQFREALKGLLTNAERMQVTKELKDSDDSTVKIDNAVQELKKQYNADQVAALLQSVGINDSAFVSRIRSDNVSAGEIKDYLSSVYKNLTADQKKVFLQKLRGTMKDVTQCAMKAEAKIIKDFGNRLKQQEKRLEQDAKRLKGIADTYEKRAGVLDKLSDKWQNRSDLFENMSARLNEWRDQMIQRAGELQQKFQQRIDDWKNKTSDWENRTFNGSMMRDRIKERLWNKSGENHSNNESGNESGN